MPRVTGTLTQTAVGLPIVNVADVAGAQTAADVSGAVAAIPDATASAKGLATAAQVSKLNGIAAGAQVNPAFGTAAGTAAEGNDARLSQVATDLAPRAVRVFATCAEARANLTAQMSRIEVAGRGTFVLDGTSVAADSGDEYTTAIKRSAIDGAWLWEGARFAALTPAGTVAVSGIDGTQFPGTTVTAGVLAMGRGGKSATDTALDTNNSTPVLVQTLTGLGNSQVYIARIVFRVTIWKDATQAHAGHLDCPLDASIVTDGTGVATVTFSTVPSFAASLLVAGIVGAAATVAASAGGFTVSATRVSGVACSARAAWWCISMENITSSAPALPAYVRITTTADATTLTPLVVLAAGSTATVRWVCEETAEELTGLSPTFTWGTAATRHVRMYVENGTVDSRADVRTFNLGFSASDDVGRYNLGFGAEHPAQPVALVEHIRGLTGLLNFCASNTQLAGTLDFAGCAALQHVELYSANVSSITLPFATDFRRLCVENCALTELDLGPVASTIYDVRAAIQQGGALQFTALSSPLARCYHFCVRDQTVTGFPTDAQMPVIEELWCWNTGQTRALAPISTALTSLQAYSNAWASVTLPEGALNLDDIRLASCTLSTAEVDAVLGVTDAYATSNGVLDLGTNAGPTATGELSALALVARGWTVTREAQVGDGVLSDDFNRADGAVGNGWISPAGFSATAVIASNMLQRTDNAAYQVYVNPAGGGLPADYTVTATLPHATAQNSAFLGLVGRWDGTQGVRCLLMAGPPFDYSQITVGDASAYNANNVTLIEDAPMPASWAVVQNHTLAMRMTGTLIEVLFDGVLVCHGTVTTNAAVTGSGYGCCGEGIDRLWDSIGTSV